MHPVLHLIDVVFEGTCQVVSLSEGHNILLWEEPHLMHSVEQRMTLHSERETRQVTDKGMHHVAMVTSTQGTLTPMALRSLFRALMLFFSVMGQL